MGELILIRHGQTSWNKEVIFRGRADIELSSYGIKQAEVLAKRLKNRKIDKIYSSPLLRAYQTALIISKEHKLEVIKDFAFIDFCFGEWEGKKLDEVEKIYKDEIFLWKNHPEKFLAPKGESLEDVRERVMPRIKEIVKVNENILVVSHRVVLKVIILSLLNLPLKYFWNIKIDTCGMSIFEYENGRFILSLHNDTSHLENLGYKDKIDF